MEHSWIPSGLYDEHCVHKFPCVGSGWAGVHLNTTGQSRSTSPLVAHLWTAGCWLADGDVTDDRDPWCWICVSATQNFSGWLWHSLIAECIQPTAMVYFVVRRQTAVTYCSKSKRLLLFVSAHRIKMYPGGGRIVSSIIVLNTSWPCWSSVSPTAGHGYTQKATPRVIPT